MANWETARFEDLSDDEPPRPNRGHSFRGIHGKQGYPQFCRFCGHVPLKNAISVLVTKIGCGYATDARYRDWVRTGRASG